MNIAVPDRWILCTVGVASICCGSAWNSHRESC